MCASSDRYTGELMYKIYSHHLPKNKLISSLLICRQDAKIKKIVRKRNKKKTTMKKDIKKNDILGRKHCPGREKNSMCGGGDGKK